MNQRFKNWINTASKSLYVCNRIISSKYLSHGTKIIIYYKTIICITTSVWIRSKTWRLKKKEKKVFENKALRKIYRPACEQGEWRRKHNRDTITH